MPRPDPVRFELDLRRRGFPSVPIFGRYHYSNARPGLAPHRHPDAIEICHLVRGRQVYEVGGRRFGLRGGDLFLTFPGEDHGTGREPEEKGLLFWVVVLNPRRTHGSLLGLAPGESLALWKALIAIRRTGHRHFPAVPAVKRHLDLLAAVTHERQSPLLCVAIRLEFLIQHIAAHLEEPEQLTLDKLAAITRLSLSRFQAKFKAATGIPPAE